MRLDRLIMWGRFVFDCLLRLYAFGLIAILVLTLAAEGRIAFIERRPLVGLIIVAITLVVIGASAYYAYSIWADITGQIRDQYRRRLGLCLHCGYDMRASGSRCPECGQENPHLRRRGGNRRI